MHALPSDPRDPGYHPIGLNPTMLGATIDAIGSSGFASAVASLVTGQIPGDAVHLERWRINPGSASGYRVEWLGSGGSRETELCTLMDVYYRDYALTDPLFLPVRGRSGTLLLQRHVGGLADGEFRRRFFDEPRIAQECVLVRGNAHIQYAIALTRTSDQARFSSVELFQFRQMADLLFPLAELNARTCAALRVAPSPLACAAPPARFDARVARQAIRLSRREHDICRLLLSGRTLPEAAAHLDVKLSTADSFKQRAFAKLGIRTRRELFDWAFTGD